MFTTVNGTCLINPDQRMKPLKNQVRKREENRIGKSRASRRAERRAREGRVEAPCGQVPGLRPALGVAASGSGTAGSCETPPRGVRFGARRPRPGETGAGESLGVLLHARSRTSGTGRDAGWGGAGRGGTRPLKREGGSESKEEKSRERGQWGPAPRERQEPTRGQERVQ